MHIAGELRYYRPVRRVQAVQWHAALLSHATAELQVSEKKLLQPTASHYGFRSE